MKPTGPGVTWFNVKFLAIYLPTAHILLAAALIGLPFVPAWSSDSQQDAMKARLVRECFAFSSRAPSGYGYVGFQFAADHPQFPARRYGDACVATVVESRDFPNAIQRLQDLVRVVGSDCAQQGHQRNIWVQDAPSPSMAAAARREVSARCRLFMSELLERIDRWNFEITLETKLSATPPAPTTRPSSNPQTVR